MQLLTRDKKGKWASFRTQLIRGSSGGPTDDAGHFRISGLPAGEYLLRVSLELSETYTDRIFGNENSTSGSTKYGLDVYSGDTFRQRDAKPVKVAEGEEADDLTMTVPVSRLHAVTGSVVEAETGRVVNAGRVEIDYGDDDAQVVSTKVEAEDSAFHFPFVPEGEYVIRVWDAADVTRQEVSNGPGSMPPTRVVEKKVRSYGPAEQPLVLHGDVSGVTLAVKALAWK